MRSKAEFELVRGLLAEGLNDCEIARRTGIPRGTVRCWRIEPSKGPCAVRLPSDRSCPICGDGEIDPPMYAYLLGLYLGDGCLTEVKRNLFKLRIALDLTYPGIIGECDDAIEVVRGRKPKHGPREGCVEVYSLWRHWFCLFPQHAVGQKHMRHIELAGWQLEITRSHPDRFLRGLIHSDGCRVINTIKKPKISYSYPRYMFTNFSPDIRAIFCAACDDYGVRCRQMNWKTISIAPRADVAKMDLVVGPKR